MSDHTDPRERPDSTEQRLEDGFDAIMDSINRLTPQEIAALRLQAKSVELAYDAYALGQELLEHGKTEQGDRWLRIADQYGVAGAGRMLDELGRSDASDHDASHVREADRRLGSSTARARSRAGLFGEHGGATAVGRERTPDTMPATWLGAVKETGRASSKLVADEARSPRQGTMYVSALTGGISVPPDTQETVWFGRNRLDVDVCLGEDDIQVSRRHGTLFYYDDQWWVRNIGRSPIRIGNQDLFPGGYFELSTGYSSIFIRGSGRRWHLLEVFVTGPGCALPIPRYEDPDEGPKVWPLTDDEKLVLVVLSQRYLRYDPFPQPVSLRDAAEALIELCPEKTWTPKSVERIVTEVRIRLSGAGVAGLRREEIGEPVGNALNHNLIKELLRSTTLTSLDLRLIDHPDVA